MAEATVQRMTVTGTGGRVDAAGGAGAVARDLPGLAGAYARCREVTRQRARNFYYGLRLTPEPRRSAIYSVYAWMRAADDAVDEAGSDADRRERLAAFAARTRAVLDGDIGAAEGGDESWMWRAIGATAAEYALDRAIFADMLEGLRADLGEPGAGDGTGAFGTEAALSRYCYCVAGTAGLACLAIWGLRDGADAERARRLGVHRGEAFQRTNMLRDFAQDFDDAPRRVYLAAEAFAEAKITPGELRAWSNPSRCEDFVRRQAARARRHYAASAELEKMVDAACAPTLWAMTRIYSGLLERIEQQPRRIVSQRVRLPSVAKASIAMSAAIKARRGMW